MQKKFRKDRVRKNVIRTKGVAGESRVEPPLTVRPGQLLLPSGNAYGGLVKRTVKQASDEKKAISQFIKNLKSDPRTKWEIITNRPNHVLVLKAPLRDDLSGYAEYGWAGPFKYLEEQYSETGPFSNKKKTVPFMEIGLIRSEKILSNKELKELAGKNLPKKRQKNSNRVTHENFTKRKHYKVNPIAHGIELPTFAESPQKSSISCLRRYGIPIAGESQSCGSFGCIFDIDGYSDWIVKLTSDESEAAAASAIQKISRRPTAIPDVRAVFALPGGAENHYHTYGIIMPRLRPLKKAGPASSRFAKRLLRGRSARSKSEWIRWIKEQADNRWPESRDFARGVAHLAKSGVVVTDMAGPGNIREDSFGNWVIADLGQAKVSSANIPWISKKLAKKVIASLNQKNEARTKIHKYTRDWTKATDPVDLGHLSGGSLIKFSTGSERPWAIVVDFDGKNITAILDNKMLDGSMKIGDLVLLQTKHVLDLEKGGRRSKAIARHHLTKPLEAAKIPKKAKLLSSGRGAGCIRAYQIKNDVRIVAGDLDITPYTKGLRSKSKKEQLSSMTRLSGALTDSQLKNFFQLFE